MRRIIACDRNSKGITLLLDKARIEVKIPPSEEKDVYLPIQKHTNRIIVVDKEPFPQKIGDAVITELENVKIGVRTADCVPLILVGENTVGAVHVGWRGLRSGIVERALERFLLKEDRRSLFAFLGPCAKGCCYRVGEEFRDLFPEDVIFRGEGIYMDMEEAVMRRLKNLGVEVIAHTGLCTICNTSLPSHRRDRSRERLITSVVKYNLDV